MTCTANRCTAAVEPAATLAPEWHALMGHLAAPLPFHHPAWHAAWWRAHGVESGAQPCTLALREDGRLVGLLPLMRRGDTLALAGDPEVCDYADLLVAPRGSALLPEALAALAALPWRTLSLWGLPADAPVLPAVAAWAEGHGYPLRTESEAVTPRLPLPASWDAYLEALPKRDRGEVRRKLRRFAELGEVVCHLHTTPQAVAAALPAFFALHRASRADKAQFMTEAMAGFFTESAVALAADGLVRLLLIEVSGAPAAALLGFRSGAEWLLYNSGYDPALTAASAGIASKALAVQAAIAEGCTTFDFLRGAEPYKYSLGAVDRAVTRLWITRDE